MVSYATIYAIYGISFAQFVKGVEAQPQNYTTTSTSTPAKILSSSKYIDTIDIMHVVGEVQNVSPSSVVGTDVTVTGTFYDSSNIIVGTMAAP